MSKQNAVQVESIESETVTAAASASLPHRILVTSGSESSFGKSTLVRHLLKPALTYYFPAGVRFLAVEEEGRLSTGEDAKYHAAEVASIIAELEMLDSDEAAILEIGAQRFDAFAAELARVPAGSFNFDKVVVPLSGSSLKSEETFKSIVKILECGIRAQDVHVVFNQVEIMSVTTGTFAKTQETQYKPFLDSLRGLGIKVCPTPIIKSDIFAALRAQDGDEFTVTSLASKPLGYYTQRAKAARKAGDEAAKLENIAMSVLQLQAGAMSGDFRKIFQFIFPELPLVELQ